MSISGVGDTGRAVTELTHLDRTLLKQRRQRPKQARADLHITRESKQPAGHEYFLLGPIHPSELRRGRDDHQRAGVGRSQSVPKGLRVRGGQRVVDEVEEPASELRRLGLHRLRGEVAVDDRGRSECLQILAVWRRRGGDDGREA